jgi:hypothetical protein
MNRPGGRRPEDRPGKAPRAFPSRGRSLLACALVYLAAGATAWAAALAGAPPLGALPAGGHPAGSHPLILAAAAADLAATLVVFAGSFLFDNSSLYDPYWSAAPLPIALYWMAGAPAGAGLARRSRSWRCWRSGRCA